MRVYLSPSGQTHNVGIGDYGTEEARCRKVAELAAGILRDAGVIVQITPRAWNTSLSDSAWLAAVCKASTDFRADAHIAIHTNAGGRGADGSMAFHYPGSVKGKNLTEAIYSRVAAVSPGSDMGIRTSPVWYEIQHAVAPVAYLELMFHTDKAEVTSMISDPDDYAEAIAEGVLAYAGIDATPAPSPTAHPMIAIEDRPQLKAAMIRFLIREINASRPMSLAGLDALNVLSERWGEPARTLAWRVSGRVHTTHPQVPQSTRPTRLLYKALAG